jgi:cytochrome c oxidase subunit 2
MTDFPLFPEQASSVAPLVDGLYLFLVAVTGAVSLLIWLVIFYFAIKYRRRPDNELAQEQEPPAILEMTWTVVPLIIFIGIFVAGAWVFLRMQVVPRNALEVYATGRQWMWKFQHPTGQREINELHVPVGRAVKITMASEDVIHSLWFPSFRVKADVLPNRYRTLWFEATKTGRFHIFCAEYCGTSHSGMIGSVIVMEPTDYQRWLAGGTEGSLASQGEKLFQKYACNTCHMDSGTGRGPMLAGSYGQTRPLADGSSAVIDDNYIRESILHPQAKIAAGFQPVMPTFQGQVSEEDLIRLLAYVKSLHAPQTAPTTAAQPVEPAANAGTTTSSATPGSATPSTSTNP